MRYVNAGEARERRGLAFPQHFVVVFDFEAELVSRFLLRESEEGVPKRTLGTLASSEYILKAAFPSSSPESKRPCSSSAATV